MGHGSTIQIQLVHGGFILQTFSSEDSRTEVFTSPGKLLKAVRTVVEEQSLVAKSKDDSEIAG
jgi:hypothetical protein